MLPASAAIADIQTRREDEAARALQEQAKASAEAPSPEKTAAEAEIKSQIPEVVQSGVLGRVSYSVFKRRYSSVYDQVRDKDHLLSGQVRFTGDVSGIPIVLRSLRQRDRRALAPLSRDPRIDQGEFMAQDFRYRLRMVVMSVDKIGDANFPDPPTKGQSIADWEKIETVQQALDYAEDWDETLFTIVLNTVGDMELAKHFALLEDVVNP